MKHGHHIPPDKRPAMARRALKIMESAPSYSEGLRWIEAEFDVSNPTARNLIGYGRFLEEHGSDLRLLEEKETGA